ncbi:hypothetical protein CEXT_778371 [Caerostris extrusa]|uniref:Uncharacterized protein n=1 Tax=Caerostris extrusa TaxID=172846 RepID=A0AAV4VUU2_CAEEX|nr:hypothetical protein CEXT_778371 [Caerostris extrusa]
MLDLLNFRSVENVFIFGAPIHLKMSFLYLYGMGVEVLRGEITSLAQFYLVSITPATWTKVIMGALFDVSDLSSLCRTIILLSSSLIYR